MLQNSSIKEMATTPDILVSLYLKATRDGDAALDRPSITNFKNELKSLAGIMGELDSTSSRAATVPARSATANASATANPAPAQPLPTPTPAPVAATATREDIPKSAPKTSLLEQLDECSSQMIREVKEDFNLSSELEALRMLVKIGYSKSRALLK